MYCQNLQLENLGSKQKLEICVINWYSNIQHFRNFKFKQVRNCNIVSIYIYGNFTLFYFDTFSLCVVVRENTNF